MKIFVGLIIKIKLITQKYLILKELAALKSQNEQTSLHLEDKRERLRRAELTRAHADLKSAIEESERCHREKVERKEKLEVGRFRFFHL